MTEFKEKLRESIFDKVFETSEIAKFTPKQIRSYEDSLKYYRDLKNSLDTAKEEGFVKGIEEGKNERNIEIAKNALKMGMSISDVAKLTGLSEDELNNLK